jgi:pimeloyl-ACP methyl ester carboxylesterase
MWCGGFHSDMTGTKAAHLHAWACAQGHGCVRFDYMGHGASDGAFAQGTIGRWRDDALLVLDTVCAPPAAAGPVVIVGSSMGGWIALLVALARPGRVAGLVLVAPAPDFTEDLIWARLSEEERRVLLHEGQWMRPSAYGETPYPISRALIEEGRHHLLLRNSPGAGTVIDGGEIDSVAIDAPVRILHGQRDDEVPWERSLALMAALRTRDVRATFVKAGDHRLSTPSDLALLDATCGEVALLCGPAAHGGA